MVRSEAVAATVKSLNSNTTSSTPNASSTEDAALDIRCSGEHFGFNPNIIDCESAKEHVTPDSVQYTWGNRHTGLEAIVFPLPFRIMGDRALCFFQATLVSDDARTALASLGQIRRAASALILQCAAGGESRGGVARNIGGDNNLAVVLGIYEPKVRCRGAFGPEWTSCRDVLGDMPAGVARLIFGPRSAPETQQGLPMYIDSSDDKCVVQIFSTGPSDISTWYRMWEAVTAVFSVCVRAGRGGVYTGLGDLGNIFLTMSSAAAAAAGIESLPGNASSLEATA
ncbi:hypothetical protein HO173_005889 [Letharia columbiana]|uniref:Uncharacterized protein n=1 Tax=Letharia columbiana TaxID=112416 RepID=A0A8H6FWX7_9LECA|nr:uncharacterized protein HO173_005889 [Letharia columbiana]KAF6236258.1 hypothetical protein HO173_005889 [Letharia columbiana]